MRDRPDSSKITISSPMLMLWSTASMSTRGTITSSTRTSRKRRMLLSIARSSGVKTSPVPASALSASVRSSRRLDACDGLNMRAARAQKEVCARPVLSGREGLPPSSEEEPSDPSLASEATLVEKSLIIPNCQTGSWPA
ncbi:hypothetical protein D3C72_1552070 [compost metagenome]